MEDFNSKSEQIQIINSKIQYWTDLANNNDNLNVNVYDIIDDLNSYKYDIIHDTHTLNIKHLEKRVIELQVLYPKAHFFKKKKILNEIIRLNQRINYLYDLDRRTFESKTEKILKV